MTIIRAEIRRWELVRVDHKINIVGEIWNDKKAIYYNGEIANLEDIEAVRGPTWWNVYFGGDLFRADISEQVV